MVELTSYRGEEVQETMPRQAPAEGEQAEAGPALPTVDELVELCRLKEHRAVYDAGVPMRITSKIRLPNAGVEGRAVTWVDGDHRQRSEQTFGKFGEQVQVLSAGDAYRFNSRIPHRFRNVGNEDCIIVSACTPPSF